MKKTLDILAWFLVVTLAAVVAVAFLIVAVITKGIFLLALAVVGLMAWAMMRVL